MLVTAVSCRCAVYMQSMTKLADLAVHVRWRLERESAAAWREGRSRPQTVTRQSRAVGPDHAPDHKVRYVVCFTLPNVTRGHLPPPRFASARGRAGARPRPGDGRDGPPRLGPVAGSARRREFPLQARWHTKREFDPTPAPVSLLLSFSWVMAPRGRYEIGMKGGAC